MEVCERDAEMSRKPGSLQGLVVKKGEATSSNRYIGDAVQPSEKKPRKPTRQASKPEADKVDGRTLRKTGRTLKFAATVKPEWVEEVKAIAAKEGKLIVEVLEEMLEAKKQQGRR